MPGPLDYSTTAASNTTVGGVSIAEGMQAGLMNDALRAAMADTRKWQLDWSGIVTAGAGNAYTITTNQGVTAYADGMRFSFRADRNNTGAATLNVDSRGAKALRKLSSGALAALGADDLVAEAVYDVVYDLSSDVFVIVGFAPPTISAFAQTLLDDADAAAARTTLGAQASDANLTSIAGLAVTEASILYGVAADTFNVLAKGTGGQALIMNAAANAPRWASGSKVLIIGRTASGSSSLSFTEFDNTIYRYYEFELESVKPATDGVTLLARLSTDNGASYDSAASDYATSGITYVSGGSVSGFGGTAGSIALTASTDVGNAATERGVTGTVKVFLAAETGSQTRVNFSLGYDNTATGMTWCDGRGVRRADQDTDGIRFLFNSGNIASGTIRMYGIT